MPTRDQSILVVDDEALFRQTVVIALRQTNMGIRVFEAEDGEAAFKLLEQRPFELVITDLRMPKLDGVALLNRVNNLKDPPVVVVVSAHATPEEERWLLTNRSFALIEKPVELSDLVSIVQDVLQRNEPTTVDSVMALDLCRRLVGEGKIYEVSVCGKQTCGRISVANGKIVRAVTANDEGESALLEMFGWGLINAQVTELARNIARSWQPPTVDLEATALAAGRSEFPGRTTLPGLDIRSSLQSAGMAPGPQPQQTRRTRVDSPTRRHPAVLDTQHEVATTPTVRPPPASLTPTSDLPETRKIQQIENNDTKGIHNTMAKFDFTKATGLDGFIGVSLVEVESGMSLAAEGGGGLNLDLAAAANAEVVKAKRRAMSALGLNDRIEDILITLGKHYHLIRPLAKKEGYFIYMAIDRSRANLAMARAMLADVEKNLEF